VTELKEPTNHQVGSWMLDRNLYKDFGSGLKTTGIANSDHHAANPRAALSIIALHMLLYQAQFCVCYYVSCP
jgi:hypothetical protein